MRTSPGGADCSSLAATFTVSPATNVLPIDGSLATTSPVLTPIAQLKPDTEPGDQFLLVQATEDLLEFVRSGHGPERVVLVGARAPENGHHRVTDELLDRPAAPFEHLAGDREEPRQDGEQGFRIELLTDPGGVLEVGEEHGDEPA